ncbi:MAG: SIS domain-containing protein [Pseudomonadota bacterium]|nr:SIS domain-containing protein [Pseudomonadota bacterium]
MRFDEYINGHVATANLCRQLEGVLNQAAEIIAGAIKRGGKLILAGNGGSAADAQHVAAELVGRFRNDRYALPSIALTTDTSAITAIGNDYGFEEIFSRQIEALGKPGDCFLAISTSGNSQNIIRAVEAAESKGLQVVLLLGKGGGALTNEGAVSIIIESDVTSYIQECHLIIEHYLCLRLESELGLA